jgi:hypothetical protein
MTGLRAVFLFEDCPGYRGASSSGMTLACFTNEGRRHNRCVVDAMLSPLKVQPTAAKLKAFGPGDRRF